MNLAALSGQSAYFTFTERKVYILNDYFFKSIGFYSGCIG